MAEDMFSLQQEALRRAREMHSRAAPPPPPHPQQQRTQNQRREPPPPPREEKKEPPKPNHEEKPPDLLDVLFKDKDRTIILALLILLSGENGDNTLLYALMYLLL